MDDIDKAQAIIEAEEIARHWTARMTVGISLVFCEDCGTEMPEKRRLALPGVRTCLECAVHRELKNAEDF